MRKFQYTVSAAEGIHARPAALLVEAAENSGSSIVIEKNGKTADCKRILALMALDVKRGDTVTITVEGLDEASAAEAMERYCREHL